MESQDTMEQKAEAADATKGGAPPRLRLPLATIQDVRRELARIYRDGKSGAREIADVSRLANVLQILCRVIEGGELEQRIAKLEAVSNDKSA